MTIKAIEATASPLGRVRLVFGDDTKKMVHPSVVADLGLYPGRELDEAGLAELERLEGQASAKNRAVRIVAAGSVSQNDLRRRLLAKGEDPEDAEQAVAWLKEMELLDDGRTAREIVQRGVRRGYGPARIRQMLYEKQIPKQYWAEALEEIPPMDDALDTFLSGRFRGVVPDEKTVKKAVDAALRRGFSYGQIRPALRRCMEGLEQVLEE